MKREDHEPLEYEGPKGEIRKCYFEQRDLQVMGIVWDEIGTPECTVWMACPECGQQYHERANIGPPPPLPANVNA
jgi:hypothetical protein